MIQVNHLSKSYISPDGKEVQVLKDITCHIEKGEVISIIGPSGTGKSTFLRALNLLDPPTGGEIIIDNQNILEKNYPLNKLRQHMGMVFQNFNLFEHLTILENLTIGPIKLLGLSKEEAEKEAMQMLRKVGMSEKADVMPSTLSGGQKQRVAIARCLCMHPAIILFDEPTSALDPTMVGEVLSVIRQLANFINEGTIYEEGTPEQIFNHPQREATHTFINRVRTLRYQVDKSDCDIYGFFTEVMQFCIHYGISEKARLVKHIIDEFVTSLLRPNELATIILSFSENDYTLTLSILIEGMTESPLSRKIADDFSVRIVRGMAKSFTEENTPEGYLFKCML